MIKHHANAPETGSETFLLDNHNRPINYLRLSITDRCNLRCRYCRPEEGVPFVPHEEILSFEELEHLAAIFCGMFTVDLDRNGAGAAPQLRLFAVAL